jgi:8-oxo-dGTP diphosphatase
MGCLIEVGLEVANTRHQYEFAEIDLTTFWCRLLDGSPQAIEHSAIKWLEPSELGTVEWAPADIPTVEAIQAGYRP